MPNNNEWLRESIKWYDGDEEWETDAFGRRYVEPPWPRVAQSLDQQWAYPHYSDERWKEARLIYGSKSETTNGAYSDRLYQWDGKAAERAGEAVKGMPPRTAQTMTA